MPDLTTVLDAAVRDALAHLRTADPDAAADLAELRRAHLRRPSVVVVGETKRGKSSLINALLGVPGLSPVDEAVATTAYLRFSPGPPGAAHPRSSSAVGLEDRGPERLVRAAEPFAVRGREHFLAVVL